MPRKTQIYIDADGNSVPAKYVRAYDKLRDQIARRILADWEAEEKRLRKLKADTLAAIDRLREAAAEEAVADMTADTQSADLVEIATKAFQPRKSGNLDMQRIRDLRHYKVRHPKWLRACEIIGDCERTVGHRRYVRVAVRAGTDETPRPVTLDIASL